MAKTDYQSIDEYISAQPEAVQPVLEEIRQNGILVHFGAHTHHIGFYPTPSTIQEFGDELSGYESSKGSVKFPLDQPMPLDLIKQMVRFRVQENLKKS